MKMYENIQHPMDIYDEILILWHSIFLNVSIHWHLELRYSIELFLNCETNKFLNWILNLNFKLCHYNITRSFARSFTFFIISKRTSSSTFFIPISHVRYIYESNLLIHFSDETS